MKDTPPFLERLLDSAGPSAFEASPARVWRAEAETFADSVSTDRMGNTMAVVNPDGLPRVMMAGHIDEIGLQITHIDEDGFLYFAEIGGWDPQVIVGQRMRLLGSSGDVPGVVGKKAIHLQKDEERKKVSEISDLWVDVGVDSRDATLALGLRVGDAMVIDADIGTLGGGSCRQSRHRQPHRCLRGPRGATAPFRGVPDVVGRCRRDGSRGDRRKRGWRSPEQRLRR